MPADPFRMAIIGTGGIARRHVQAMEDLRQRGLDDFIVTAVCDVDEEAARATAQMLQEVQGSAPAVYGDYRQILDAGGIDGVDICLPHGLHHGTAVDCMEAGAHVLCEKPLGITIRACRLMAETADRTGKVLSTAVPYRRLPGQRKVHWILNESGLIGTPQSFVHQHARPPAPVDPQQALRPAVVWRRDRLMSGGGPVMDSGFHYCDSMRYMLGEVDTVYARAFAREGDKILSLSETRENSIFATLTFKNGVTGMWSWSTASPGEEMMNLVFQGSKGSIRDLTPGRASIFHIYWREPKGDLFEVGQLTLEDGSTLTLDDITPQYREAMGEERLAALYPCGIEDGFAFEIWEFVQAARGEIDGVEVDGWGGLHSMAICQAIYESALTGDVVCVDDIISGARRKYQETIDEHWGL
ncbi:MAG TPA: Gfo/Idh/MocA family oxidoreductase [Chloroflexi bacterium]|jgi:UDP-N-acetyl-2-amino-2-deoxyglucuronate dehydrogenase|nr:Gfo/Idh/MocA family oxidoreductase [Chloroflexota bacterium]